MAKHPTPRTGPQRLLRLAVQGGFLDGLDVEFAPGLNCLIGGRGTGKTTLLEFVRYALDPAALEGPRRAGSLAALVESNLGGGRVWLHLATRDGLRYTVGRSAGEPPVVLDQQHRPTAITLGRGRFFAADIFSQNQVESIAGDSRSQLLLLDGFDAEPIQQDSHAIDQVVHALTANARDTDACRRALASLAEELGALPEVERALAEFREGQRDAAGGLEPAQQAKAQRDRETRALGAAERLIASQAAAVQALAGQFRHGLAGIFDADAVRGANADAVAALRTALGQQADAVEQHLGAVAQSLAAAAGLLATEGGRLAGCHREQELAFEALMNRHKASLAQQRRRAELEKRRNELLDQEKRRQQQEQALAALTQQRHTLREQLAARLDQRFQRRQAVVGWINEQVLPGLRLGVAQFGDLQDYEELLGGALSQAGLQHRVVARKLATALGPADLVAAVRRQDLEALSERGGISTEQAQKVIAALATGNMLDRLETVELADRPSIELRDGEDYKDSLTLSTGQKCTSILPILLLDSAKPLLVDQPEDNLDNRFIFNTVVKRLREVKQQRQLIFITHNPNIPVLGEADQVIVLESDGRHGSVRRRGTVDACKDEIVTLLEGGKDAFLERRQRYGY